MENTELIQPEKKTKLVAPSPTTKLVKVRALREIAVGETRYLAGQEVEVSEELAADLCQPISGPYAFSGLRSDHDAQMAQIVRAERVH